MSDSAVVPRWMRWWIGLALAVPQLVTGAWALLAPRNWFDEFPGLGPALVGAEPPFNEHLAADAGGAFFATGVALAIAAIVARRDVVVLALVTYLAFAVPHALYHLAHEAPGLSAGEDLVNVMMLLSAVALATVLLVVALRRRGDQRDAAGERSVGTLVSSSPNQSR